MKRQSLEWVCKCGHVTEVNPLNKNIKVGASMKMFCWKEGKNQKHECRVKA